MAGRLCFVPITGDYPATFPAGNTTARSAKAGWCAGQRSTACGHAASDHIHGQDGEAMFRHACAMGLEGMVSKRATSLYGRAAASLAERHCHGETYCLPGGCRQGPHPGRA
jgi:hypothetical protein